MGGIGIWQLLIVAVIVILLFGTKKLRNMGSDLGSAIKGFKKAISDEKKSESLAENSAIENQVDETFNNDSKAKTKTKTEDQA